MSNTLEHRRAIRRRLVAALWLFAAFAVSETRLRADAEPQLPEIISRVVQPKIVKIYGAGGLQGLEAYQSGFLISPAGHVLTAWSYVLDSDYVTATLNDGQRLEAQLLGADPKLDLAVLKIDLQDAPFFDLSKSVSLEAGDRVLALSNLFGIATGDEPASVLLGRVSVKTSLAARRGAFQTTYRGPVYVLDATTNNPGAAGGALTDQRGALAGMLGKELRSSLDNTWLNYAIPIAELTASIDDILAGKIRPRSDQDERTRPANPLTLGSLGIVLVPDVLAKTPPFVDRILPASPAQLAGLQPDDLVLMVNDLVVGSCQALLEELSYIDRIDPVRLTLQRGQQLIDTTLRAENKTD